MPRLRERVVVERGRQIMDSQQEPVPLAVLVPAADSMDDATFCAHLNRRHLGDLGLHRIQHRAETMPGYYGTLRAYHARLHAMALRGTYDHEHDDH